MTLMFILGLLFVAVPVLGLVGTGCWMLYKELKNEEEWGRIFAAMFVSFSLGALLLFIYFVLMMRDA
ncbi:MAG: hypothetical protein AAB337_03355 [Patescibacteria group bacterium]